MHQLSVTFSLVFLSYCMKIYVDCLLIIKLIYNIVEFSIIDASNSALIWRALGSRKC